MHAIFALLLASVASPDLANLMNEAEIQSAKQLIDQFITAKRGPYSGITWFCNDGTQQPPKLNGCAEHEGGVMYAIFSPQANRLFKYGIFGGTILRALTIEDIIPDNFYRARALVIEKYLERSLDGWVLARAKTYRGFRQDENEADAARELLIGLAGQRKMLSDARAILIQLSRVLPYGRGAEDLSNNIRTLAANIGDADASFANLRFKIHSLPEPSDILQVEAYAQKHNDELGKQARELAEAMQRYYDPAIRYQRLHAVRGWLAIKKVRKAIDDLLNVAKASGINITNKNNDTSNLAPINHANIDPWVLLDKGAALIKIAGTDLHPANDNKYAERNLLRLHAIGIIEELWVGIAADLHQKPLTRQQALNFFTKLINSAQLAGYLSLRELNTALNYLAAASTGDGLAYAQNIRQLGRVLSWARARLDFELGIPMARYKAIEPKSSMVIDDMLRSGLMLPLATLYDRLAADAERLLGGGHQLVGIKVDAKSLLGENPGLAIGPLQLAHTPNDIHFLKRNNIALLYDLPPELPRVAGILTISSPGSLSHVALLARNLGIPLATIGSDVANALEPFANQEILIGVSPGRKVILGPLTAFDATTKKLFGDINQSKDLANNKMALTIDATRLDLTTTKIFSLDEITENDAGVIVGPKAAELGRLKRLFPNRVSDAAIIPFGAFVKHVDLTKAGELSALAKLKTAYVKYLQNKNSPNNNAQTEILNALAKFRQYILSEPFAPGFELQIRQALLRLGKPGTFGVFIRSDTNVEDLKNFTGAGLNLTVFNRVSIREIYKAIREVWASPYSERSFRWRQELLVNPEHVYPSVILHRTVSSQISGVVVTTDLETLDNTAITISAAEGVAGVVDGGLPETIVLRANGTTRFLSSARSATRKIIPKPPAQGVVMAAALGIDPLLDNDDIFELRNLVNEVKTKMPKSDHNVPWDIEFGIWHHQAYLMQIRPLKISKIPSTIPLLVKLDADRRIASIPIALNEALP